MYLLIIDHRNSIIKNIPTYNHNIIIKKKNTFIFMINNFLSYRCFTIFFHVSITYQIILTPLSKIKYTICPTEGVFGKKLCILIKKSFIFMNPIISTFGIYTT